MRLLVNVFIVTFFAVLLSESSSLSFIKAFVILFGLMILGIATGAITRYSQIKK